MSRLRRRTRAEQFAAKAMDDIEGAFTMLMCALGDRLGLLRDLAGHGPATSAELAARTGLDERYIREWLCALRSAGYLRYEASSGRFVLPPAHAAALAEEASPLSLEGYYRQLPHLAAAFERVARAIRESSGVALADYDSRLWEAMEQLDNVRPLAGLQVEWLNALHEVRAALTRGACGAGLGWGSGGALIDLALAYPASHFAGYDFFRPRVARRTAQAQGAGAFGRVHFHHLDVARQDLPERYDLILMFDALSEAADPRKILEVVRRALKPGGRCIVREHAAREASERQGRQSGAIVHALSLLYYLPASLGQAAQDDMPGGGTLTQARIRRLSAEAGFGAVRRLPVEDRLNAFYELRP